MRVKTSAFLAAALFVGLAAQSAMAADGYGAFKSFCLDTHGDQSSSLAAADNHGWAKVDKDLSTIPMTGSFKLKQASIRQSQDGVLIVGSGETTGVGPQPEPANICMIVGPVDAKGYASAGEWVGQPPFATVNLPSKSVTAKMNIYMFNDEASGRSAVDISKLKTGGRLSGPVTMLMTMDMSSPIGVLAYIAIKPTP